MSGVLGLGAGLFCSSHNPSGKGFSPRYSPTFAQFVAMPTGLAALRATLISQP